MIAEDEDGVRDLACDFLRSSGYNVLAAASGREALETAKRWDKPIHVLLTDMVMANMRGPELARELKRSYPDLQAVYMSGYHDYANSGADMEEEGALFVQKPFSREQLLSMLREALKVRAAEQQSVPAVQSRVAVPRKAPEGSMPRRGSRMAV